MKRPALVWLAIWGLWLVRSALLSVQPKPARLPVSPDGYSLVRADGTPFFWLGDTAWNLFARLNRAEAERYLHDRAAKRFTVIQAHLLAWGAQTPNVTGQTALVNGNFDQPNPAYWQHVDTLV